MARGWPYPSWQAISMWLLRSQRKRKGKGMPLVIWHPFVDSGSLGRRAGHHPISVTPSGIMRVSFWAPGTHCKSLIHSRFILLMFYPCSCRYVQPCTPIYDLTPRDAVVHGQFFYSSSTSQLTALAIVHGFIRSPGVNQASSGRFTFLRRLMAMWVNRYRDDPMLDMSSSAHIPNTCNADGLKDIMAIGNVLELATILDRRSYVGTG